MKRFFLSTVIAVAGLMTVQAQDVNDASFPTVEEKGQLGVILFKDNGIRDFCVEWLKTVDVNKDGQVTIEEAAAVKELNLMCFKSFIRFIKDYDDLQYFPNLEYFHAGTSYAETVDVSCCPKLKELDLSDCRMLKTIVLAKGCKPTIKYPVAYKGEQAKIEYRSSQAEPVHKPQHRDDIHITCPQCGAEFTGKSASLFFDNPHNHKKDCPLFNKVPDVPQVPQVPK